jgi:hypothetical protein
MTSADRRRHIIAMAAGRLAAHAGSVRCAFARSSPGSDPVHPRRILVRECGSGLCPSTASDLTSDAINEQQTDRNKTRAGRDCIHAGLVAACECECEL